MKKNFKIILAVLAMSIALWSFMPKKQNDPEKQKMLLDLITFVLEKGHYNPIAMDDKLSKGVYKDFINTVDGSKRFFTEPDLKEFSVYENQIDDMIKNRDLTFFNLVYNRLKIRMNEAKPLYKAVVEKPFTFSEDENLNLDTEKLAFAKDQIELKNRWRTTIKYSILSSVSEKLKLEDDKFKKDSKYVKKTFVELEAESRKSTTENLDEYFKTMADYDEEYFFSVFINSFVSQYDPHTNYLAPEEKVKFDIDISGKLEGIGARLQKKSDFTEITELISGGPAWKNKELKPGDIILKVAQGDEKPEDVVGMKIDNVVKRIKGKKGTVVQLTVKSLEGVIKVVKIVRDVVEIDETYAKSSIIENNGKKFGVIYLPKFYIDFENEDNRDAYKDVAIEIEQLKKAGIEGVIMDLRDNGGGSLQTVIDIAGLFVPQGPIVQVKSANGKIETPVFPKIPKVKWDGPLVVMINNFSASASEIFAAAMQDYNRAIIMGSKQSYGKGTVQNVVVLNKFVRNSSMGDFGALKTTTQKFYRVNGGSTQLEGVASDIVMPDRFAYIKIGERDSEHAMAWDKIPAATFSASVKTPVYQSLIENSKKRIALNPQFKLIDESAKWYGDRKEDNEVSLNFEKFEKEQKSFDEIVKKFKPISEYKTMLKFSSPPNDAELIKKDSTQAQKRQEWHDVMAKDVYLEEAVNVMGDMKNTVAAPKTIVIKKGKEKLIKS